MMTTQTWFMTGTSVGLGRALAEAALAAGYNVTATARDTATLADLVAAHPGHCLALPFDVTDAAQWQTAVETASARFGGIDVLVNNAGFAGVGAVEDTPLTLIRQQLETNYVGAVHACRAVLPSMRQRGYGRIVLVSSIGARIATPGAAFYYASKAAVSALARSLALEVGPLGIQVSAVEPGAMRTRFAEDASLKVAPFDAAYASTVGATAARMRSSEYAARLRDPAGVAAMILELASLPEMPVRILAGEDAFEYGMAADTVQAESDQRWERLSRSASVA